MDWWLHCWAEVQRDALLAAYIYHHVQDLQTASGRLLASALHLHLLDPLTRHLPVFTSQMGAVEPQMQPPVMQLAVEVQVE